MQTSVSIPPGTPAILPTPSRRQVATISLALVAVLVLGIYLVWSDVAIERWHATPLEERYGFEELRETFDVLQRARAANDVEAILALHDSAAVASHQGRSTEDVQHRQRSHLEARPEISKQWATAKMVSIRVDPEWTHNWGHEIIVVTCDNGKRGWFHRTEEGWRALVFESMRDGRRGRRR